MQQPTIRDLRVRSPADAQVIFHAVALNILPMVARRLDTEERRAIASGSVFVWEERGPNAEATGLGIERWTDGIRWGPSRVRDEFLFYHEKDHDQLDAEPASDSDASPPRRDLGFLRQSLVKQTYSVFVETPRGRRKWHLIAYFTTDSVDYLRAVDDFPQLAALRVPPGTYKSARSAKGRPRDALAAAAAAAHLRGAPHAPFASYGAGAGVGGRGLQRVAWGGGGGAGGGGAGAGRWGASKALAPLEYLENMPPPRRHPLDEKALMSFSAGPA